MSNAVYNRLSFNGWHVTFYDNRDRIIRTRHFTNADAVAYSNSDDEFPSLEDFVEDYFTVYGDIVGQVVDSNDNVLLDNMVEMNETYESLSNW